MNNELIQNLVMASFFVLFFGTIYVWAVRGIQEIDFQSPELRKKYSKLRLPFFNYKKPS